MHERPDPGALLEAARRTVLDSLLAHLPREKHYEARMVANALAIAGRALHAPQPAQDAAALARGIREAPPLPGSAEYARIHAALRELTRARCAVSAPKAIA